MRDESDMRRRDTPVVDDRDSRRGGVVSLEPRDPGDTDELEAELEGSGSDAAVTSVGDVLMTAGVASTCDRERAMLLPLRLVPKVGRGCADEGEANMGAMALCDRLKKRKSDEKT